MTSDAFDPAWLSLREAVDHRSRAHELTRELAAWWGRRHGTRVLDLGSGTGSNLRYLAPRLGGAQAWELLDHDPELLGRAQTDEPGVRLERTVRDLADLDAEDVASVDLLTASALLDLVSATWLQDLAVACASAGCAALLTLTYDGAIRWSRQARLPEDDLVRDAVNAHQRRDKGIGSALGPDAGRFGEGVFAAVGHGVQVAPSPWHLGPGDADVAMTLVDGWSAAAAEEMPGERDRITEWATAKRAAIRGGDFGLVVGHVDLLALPPDPATAAA